MVSARPFQVVGEYGPPIFQRGVLHIRYQELELDVLIVHLHAHSSIAREEEAKCINKICSEIPSSQKVIIMGDFNTLSPWDAR